MKTEAICKNLVASLTGYLYLKKLDYISHSTSKILEEKLLILNIYKKLFTTLFIGT